MLFFLFYTAKSNTCTMLLYKHSSLFIHKWYFESFFTCCCCAWFGGHKTHFYECWLFLSIWRATNEQKKSIQPNLRVNKRGLSLMCKCICNVSKKVSEHKRQQNWEWKKLQTTKKQAKFLSFPLKDYDWFMIKFYRHKIKSLSWLLLFRSVQDSEVDRVNGEYLVNRVQ